MTSVPLAEQFYSVQGEGPFAGTPAVFFRTGGCNLLCGAPSEPDKPQDELEMSDDATWLCDTIEVWRNAAQRDLTDIMNEWMARGWLHPLRSGEANLVLTGGEPLLHQDALARLVERANPEVIEIETNGTIVPEALGSAATQFNVSVKLSNSGMPAERRLYPPALEWFSNSHRATFKFVVSRDADLDEIQEIQRDYEIPNRRVMLMPAGASKPELERSRPKVADLCKREGYRFSPRLQVDIWDMATGV